MNIARLYTCRWHCAAGSGPHGPRGAGLGGSAVSRLVKLGKAPEELTGAELERIGAFAGAAASLSTQRRGGIPSIVPEAQVREALGWGREDGA